MSSVTGLLCILCHWMFLSSIFNLVTDVRLSSVTSQHWKLFTNTSKSIFLSLMMNKFAHKLYWTKHVETVSFKVHTLSFSSHWLTGTDASYTPSPWLDCLPVFFSHLNEKDRTRIVKPVKLFARYTGINRNAFPNILGPLRSIWVVCRPTLTHAFMQHCPRPFLVLQLVSHWAFFILFLRVHKDSLIPCFDRREIVLSYLTVDLPL